jgi:four helix bundle protein
MRDHRNLKAFQVADQLAVALYLATKEFPREELFGLTSQMRRAAVSVPSNIVEGCSRRSEADFLRFLDIALGSSQELDYQISLARRLDYLSEPPATEICDLSQRNVQILYGLIRSYREKK